MIGEEGDALMKDSWPDEGHDAEPPPTSWVEAIEMEFDFGEVDSLE